MVRTYKRVIGKKSRRKIDLKKLEFAIKEVEKGESLRKAAQKHDIPHSVLYKRMKNPEMDTAVGRRPAMSNEF